MALKFPYPDQVHPNTATRVSERVKQAITSISRKTVKSSRLSKTHTTSHPSLAFGQISKPLQCSTSLYISDVYRLDAQNQVPTCRPIEDSSQFQTQAYEDMRATPPLATSNTTLRTARTQSLHQIKQIMKRRPSSKRSSPDSVPSFMPKRPPRPPAEQCPEPAHAFSSPSGTRPTVVELHTRTRDMQPYCEIPLYMVSEQSDTEPLQTNLTFSTATEHLDTVKVERSGSNAIDNEQEQNLSEKSKHKLSLYSGVTPYATAGSVAYGSWAREPELYGPDARSTSDTMNCKFALRPSPLRLNRSKMPYSPELPPPIPPRSPLRVPNIYTTTLQESQSQTNYGNKLAALGEIAEELSETSSYSTVSVRSSTIDVDLAEHDTPPSSPPQPAPLDSSDTYSKEQNRITVQTNDDNVLASSSDEDFDNIYEMYTNVVNNYQGNAWMQNTPAKTPNQKIENESQRWTVIQDILLASQRSPSGTRSPLEEISTLSGTYEYRQENNLRQNTSNRRIPEKRPENPLRMNSTREARTKSNSLQQDRPSIYSSKSFSGGTKYDSGFVSAPASASDDHASYLAREHAQRESKSKQAPVMYSPPNAFASWPTRTSSISTLSDRQSEVDNVPFPLQKVEINWRGRQYPVLMSEDGRTFEMPCRRQNCDAEHGKSSLHYMESRAPMIEV